MLNTVGSYAINITNKSGRFALFFVKSLYIAFTSRLKLHKTFVQANSIGLESFMIAILTGTFAGMVFALQSYIGFQRVGGVKFIGAVVAQAMVRELGPVMTGLMVTARAGSAITAEIGTMRITEQIDALKTLRINVYQYLIVPRILAGTFILPFLTSFAMLWGIIGGYVVCTYVLGLSPDDYISNIKAYVQWSDIQRGLIKSAVFGLILTWVGTYKGFYTKGGARGVGKATTQSVVSSSIMILMANYFLTKLLEGL